MGNPSHSSIVGVAAGQRRKRLFRSNGVRGGILRPAAPGQRRLAAGM
jgi:hypothetical protein